MHLLLVTGPTGVGKTACAHRLARQRRAPIIVLDRVQCHPDLAVGSGRAQSPGETPCHYLDHRTVHSGVITAEAAVTKLRALLVELSRHTDTVVLEGGSLSLLNQLAIERDWLSNAHLEIISLSPDAAFPRRVFHRVQQMLTNGDRTMLDELRALWPDPRTHPTLRGIVGYRELIAWGAHRSPRPRWPEILDAVTGAHLAYAREQIRLIPTYVAMLTSADARRRSA